MLRPTRRRGRFSDLAPLFLRLPFGPCVRHAPRSVGRQLVGSVRLGDDAERERSELPRRQFADGRSRINLGRELEHNSSRRHATRRGQRSLIAETPPRLCQRNASVHGRMPQPRFSFQKAAWGVRPSKVPKSGVGVLTSESGVGGVAPWRGPGHPRLARSTPARSAPPVVQTFRPKSTVRRAKHCIPHPGARPAASSDCVVFGNSSLGGSRGQCRNSIDGPAEAIHNSAMPRKLSSRAVVATGELPAG